MGRKIKEQRLRRRGNRLEAKSAHDGTWYWLLRARNGRILCNGETHRRPSDAKRAADRVDFLFSGSDLADLAAVIGGWTKDVDGVWWRLV